jgi:hypothetical protein
VKRFPATLALVVLVVQGAQSQDNLGSFLGAEQFGRQLERSQQGRVQTPTRNDDKTPKSKTSRTETGSASRNLYKDARVANFSVTDHAQGTPEFERLSFWSGPHGESIDYVRGRDDNRTRLTPLGLNRGGLSFAIGLPNGLMLDVEPQRHGLLVRDRAGRYRKTFVWQYEGPVEGRGTFCSPCVDQKGAVAFVREHFMR